MIGLYPPRTFLSQFSSPILACWDYEVISIMSQYINIVNMQLGLTFLCFNSVPGFKSQPTGGLYVIELPKGGGKSTFYVFCFCTLTLWIKSRTLDIHLEKIVLCKCCRCSSFHVVVTKSQPDTMPYDHIRHSEWDYLLICACVQTVPVYYRYAHFQDMWSACICGYHFNRYHFYWMYMLDTVSSLSQFWNCNWLFCQFWNWDVFKWKWVQPQGLWILPLSFWCRGQ